MTILPAGGARRHPRLRRSLAWAAFALVAAGVQPLLADDASPPNAGMSRGWAFAEQGGEQLFANVCAACHQNDAKGARGAGAYPPLAGDGKLGSTPFVLGVLLGGLRAMPPVGQMMSDQQVADVVNYARTHFGNDFAGPISAAEVSAARPRTKPAP